MSHILIIDDSESIRAQVEIQLSDLQHTCRTAANGQDAIALLRAHGPFDLVITDIFMPEMDGIETIEKLQAMQPSIKVIAISGGGVGMSGAAMLEIAEGLGAVCTLPKPFPPDALNQAVRTALAA
jgi:CheY-like chemotaxis protein